MTKESIRVLVVEDHHVVRQGLVALLNVVDGLEVVGEAADGVEAIAQFRKHQPAITLIDLRLPRLSGVEVIERIRMETPQARFIVLTTYDGDEDIYRALQAGAKAYLLKGMTSEELIETIRMVHVGKSYIPPEIAQKLTERMGTEELTPREFDVLEQPIEIKAKIRYRHREGEAVVTPLSDNRVYVRFAQPQMAITPGQAVVFYRGSVVVGGGTIERASGVDC